MAEIRTAHTARTAHDCGAYPCTIQPGDRYLLASLPPSDEDNSTDHWLRMRVCRSCAEQYGQTLDEQITPRRLARALGSPHRAQKPDARRRVPTSHPSRRPSVRRVAQGMPRRPGPETGLRAPWGPEQALTHTIGTRSGTQVAQDALSPAYLDRLTLAAIERRAAAATVYALGKGCADGR